MTNPQHSETVKHTPGPWWAFTCGKGDPNFPPPWVSICSSAGEIGGLWMPRDPRRTVSSAAVESEEQAEANAAHIVLCVNGRDALVEALKEARKMCYTQNFYEDVERIRPLVDEALKKAGAL